MIILTYENTFGPSFKQSMLRVYLSQTTQPVSISTIKHIRIVEEHQHVEAGGFICRYMCLWTPIFTQTIVDENYIMSICTMFDKNKEKQTELEVQIKGREQPSPYSMIWYIHTYLIYYFYMKAFCCRAVYGNSALTFWHHFVVCVC